MRKTFGLKREEITSEWKRLHKGGGGLGNILLTKYHLDSQIKENKIGGRCSTCGEQERFIQGYGGET